MRKLLNGDFEKVSCVKTYLAIHGFWTKCGRYEVHGGIRWNLFANNFLGRFAPLQRLELQSEIFLDSDTLKPLESVATLFSENSNYFVRRRDTLVLLVGRHGPRE
jgi:hypothetical protein